MIQFNLLPDVKLDYIQARSRKRLIIGTSIIVSAVFFGLFLLLLLFVKVNQTKYMSDLTKDINSNVKKLQDKKDLDKVLTVQNQLSSLPTLHDQKVISSRLMDYLVQLLPTQTTISSIAVDYSANTVQIKGNSENLSTVNKFVDTLKFTDYKLAQESGDPKTGRAFNSVVLESFNVEKATAGQLAGKASFSLTFKFDPIIFQNVKTAEGTGGQPITLSVPNIISTRSETEKPSGLFYQAQPESEQQGN